MFRIGEFSKIVKLTVKTLRYYDDIGLLEPEHIDKHTGYRYYSTGQLYPLQKIIALRQAGFSIEEIKTVLSGEDVEALLLAKETSLAEDIRSASERLIRLSSIRKYYLEEQSMDYQAIIKQLPEYTVYYKRFKVHSFDEYGSVIPQIGAAVIKANPDIKCVSPDYCYVEYVDGEYKEKDFEVEYAEAVDRQGTETDGIKFKTLAPSEVACVMHKGSYEGLRKAYGYLTSWIENNNYELIGNAREQYIDGCWNKDCEDEYLTEIQFPVKKRTV